MMFAVVWDFVDGASMAQTCGPSFDQTLMSIVCYLKKVKAFYAAAYINTKPSSSRLPVNQAGSR
jgi:hypothetical protein